MADVKLLVTADRTKCCGAGMCTLNAPDVFDQDLEEGLVVLLNPQPPPELHGAVRDAVGLCPASAISAEEISAEEISTDEISADEVRETERSANDINAEEQS